MPHLAATATAGLTISWLPVLGVAGLALAGWLGSLYLWPYTSCRWCNGTGRRRGTPGTYGRCRFCKGSPERLRFGARLVHRAGRR